MGLATAGAARAETPRVMVSIAPIHSLVAAAMESVAKPELLVKGGATPHTYALKPSEAKVLSDARLVFWVGENLEAFLVKPLAALAGTAKAVKLIEAPGLRLLPYRTGGFWSRGHGHDHGHGRGGTDAHIWLAPGNARAIATAIVAALAEVDPANAARYRANGRLLDDRLIALEAEMKIVLAPVQRRPFVAFHDAYQYLENAFGLNAVGVVALAPEKPPGPKALAALRARIQSQGVRCVFREPQFPAKFAETVGEGTGARIAVLDAEGAIAEPGPDLYFELMRANARSLAACLGDG
jgi:zinc transport system substrate-binding protein